MSWKEQVFVTTAVTMAASTLAVTSHLAQEPQPLTASELRAMARSHTDSLKTIAIVDAPNMTRFVVNRSALLILGKALFWDQQVGSDGQACASCHFHAGADNRVINQLNPGSQSVPPDPFFSSGADFGFRANYLLEVKDFPFHDLTRDTNDVASSQGVFNANFAGLSGTPLADQGTRDPTGLGAIFNVATGETGQVRNVEPRNTPTTIGAALNHRNFWDARARFEFNGVNTIGRLDPTARVVRMPQGRHPRPAHPQLVSVTIPASSAASQADGPPLSNREMSFAGRRFPDLGRKMLDAGTVALGLQVVDPEDSVLGPYAGSLGLDRDVLGCSVATENAYTCLIERAFDPRWWNAPGWVVDLSGPTPRFVQAASPTRPNQFTAMEFNFSLFMGLAVQEYEKTLIPNETPFDQFMEGDDARLTASQQNGLTLFLTRGKCINCHGGPEFTNASLTNVQQFEILERMIMGDDRVAVYDNGHYNTAVRRTSDDVGLGATIGPRQRPLSNSRYFQTVLARACPTADDACLRSKGIPRILARPDEAATLLSRAAALLPDGDPTRAAAEGLIADARTLLRTVPSDEELASCKMAKNPALSCPASFDPATETFVQDDGALDVLALAPSPPADLTLMLAGAASLLPDSKDPGEAPKLLAPPLQPNERVAVDGAFKTPGLRNVEFTAPYFHNGGTLTLEGVIAFYNRGGDFPLENIANLDVDVQPLGLTDTEMTDLTNFLIALSDPRVANESAPFDHPSLQVSNGSRHGATTQPTTDDTLCIPANGKFGHSTPLGTPGTPYANFTQPIIATCP